MYNTISEAVEKHRRLILQTEHYIWKNPEPGFREWKTSAYMAEVFESLGYTLTKANDIPGFYTDWDTGRPGPKILVFGELDSLICAQHPEADPETSAVHCCGHNAQCAALIGLAAALKEEGMADGLCGSIRLCAVPAEEGIEIGFREELKKKGIIHHLGGKSEFLRRGYFEGVDIALMIHTTTSPHAVILQGAVGNVRKNVRYLGVAAHAGSSPEDGVNALYAATLGLQAINSLRETFRENDLIRVHPIITKGGDAVNAIPADVQMESYVRGKTFEAIARTNERMNRALIGAALSMGCRIQITDRPGYYPLNNDPNLIKVTREAMEEILGADNVEVDDRFTTGSTDMGDLSAIMPVIHPYMPGASGTSHGMDYRITDPETACVKSAEVQLLMLRILLSDNARRAKEVIAGSRAAFRSKEEYFSHIRVLESSGEKIEYAPDGTIRLL